MYDPLVDYYDTNRIELKKLILKHYPRCVETILYKSLQKMKKASKEKIIDYALIKCRL